MSAHDVELSAAWQHHVSSDTGHLEGLLTRYRERHRRYHTATHLTWVVRHVDELAGDESVVDVGAVIAAAFYHDAVYEPTHPANERASARLAGRDLTDLGWDADRVEAVMAMIEATQVHADPVDLDTAVLIDADLAILGADPPAYSAYVTAVRVEYRHLDDAEWTAGRSGVLRSFSERDTIYSTDGGRERWEARARANLAAELATLT